MPTWSGIRNKLEKDSLCPSLRGRIQYFATSYSKCPDHEGRAAVRLDGKEVLKSGYYQYCIAAWRAGQAIEAAQPGASRRERWQMAQQAALDGGDFDQRDLYAAFQEFDNQSIGDSLHSKDPLVRMFAILDRRVGKRRLISMRETMEQELEWLQFFYFLRLSSENIILNAGDQKLKDLTQ